MYPAVEKVVKPIVDRSINVVTNTLSGTREAVVSGANFLERTERPVKILTNASLRLNKITHHSIASLVRVEGHMIEGTLAATARRLEKAANANSFRQLVSDQMALMPKTRDRLAKDARKTLDVFVETRDDLREMISDTVAEFGEAGKDVATRARSAARKTTKTAKRTTKKATAKARKSGAQAKKAVRKTVAKATK